MFNPTEINFMSKDKATELVKILNDDDAVENHENWVVRVHAGDHFLSLYDADGFVGNL